MASTNKIRPPFVWMGRHTVPASLAIVLALGAFFRFYQLNTLPPGLYEGTAALGLQAANLAEKGQWAAMSIANGYSPLWLLIQALGVKLFGHTSLALHFWPALLGTLAIATTWLWARAWFGLRIAWLSSFLLAVTPWAVTLSRNAQIAALMPLLVSSTLWVAALARRQPSTRNHLALGIMLGLSLLSGPIGWLLAGGVVLAGLYLTVRERQFTTPSKPKIIGASAIAVGLAGLGYSVAVSLENLKHLPSAIGLTNSLSSLGDNFVRTLLMFNVRGDDNYRHNLAGEPMLNAFIGLMLITGLLVTISRLHQRRYRFLLGLTLLMLVPALLSTIGSPNAAHTVGMMPLILTIAAIGISYMLELWYATFPINSAARTAGQSAIILLLGLTLFQGYTQYFRAWAASSEVYRAYNEGPAQIANNLRSDKFAGQRYLVSTPGEQTVVEFLNNGKTQYLALQPKDITNLPVAPTGRRFIISATARDESVKILKDKFPGGVLRPHYSYFNQAEIYYTYEVAK